VTTSKHYWNSPITEAVIDIRVEVSPDFNTDSLESIHAQISKDFSKREEIMFFQGQFNPTADPTTSATQTKQGYLYRSNNGKYILQTRTNGFTFSHLPPYETWNTFRSEARKLWDTYREVAKPVRVTRVAVRSINRIDLPPPVDLKEYFNTFPEVAPGMPQMLSGYVMQLLIAQEDFGGMLSLIQATAIAPRPDVASIVLDIDLYKESSSEFDSDEKIWQLLELIRDRKNEVFESCVTDKARDIFKPSE
jgi:uncharacterized protein (TIGR04255 family)